MRMATVLWVGIGGFLGANARYFLTILITQQIVNRWGGSFPLGTLVVNFAGSLLLALFIVWSARQIDLPDEVRLLVAAGFFGAFTTFSTFANESIALFQTGHWLSGLANIVGTNVICLLGVLVGLALGHHLLR
jgi:fluoride exporter